MFYKAWQLMVAQIHKSEFLIGIKRKHLQFSCACHCNQEACKTRIKTKKFNEARMTAVESEHEMTQLSPLTAWFQMRVLAEHQRYSHYQINSGEGNGTPLQYSCLENPMDGGAWQAAVYGVAKSQTRLSDFTFSFHFHALEKEMATHSSVLAWRMPGTGEPGGLPSMGSHRVRHD